MKWIVVEDHPLVKEAIHEGLSEHYKKVSFYMADNGVEALELFKQHDFELLFTDIQMAKMSGIQLAEIIKVKCPKTKIIFYTQFNDTRYVSQAISIEVDAYVLKTAPFPELVAIIDKVMKGGTHFDEGALETLKLNQQTIDLLSDRQLEVVQLLCKGMSAREIAQELNITIGTVKTHRKKVYETLGFNHITQLTKWAIENKIT